MSPRGILRNKLDGTGHHENEEFDRQEVIRNTRLNAQLLAEKSKGEEIRAKLAEKKAHADDHLKWDEINLYKAEQEKSATMKIDEPKTPYEGGFDPLGEYYQEDEEIPTFELGESEAQEKEDFRSLNGGEIIPNENQEEEEEPKQELTAEEKHKRFEELRKKHYHAAANPLKQKFSVEDEE